MRAIDLRLTMGLVLVALASRADAQVPPVGEWRTVESEHFRVTYAEGLDALAEHAARRAEVAYERLSASLARGPAGKIDVVLTDNVDYTNGFATPFPSNRIFIYARPPVGVEGLDFHRDWIDLVVTHELTHIFHLDRAGWVGRALRQVFGRLPLSWPVFPVAGTPGWSIEGLATHVESDFTGAGRVHGSYHDMVVRTAVLADRFDPFDRLSASSPIWPGDERIYIYGSLFFDYLADRFGADVRRRIVDRTAGAVIPPVLWFDRIGSGAFGISFSEAYDDWHESLKRRHSRLADSLRAAGLTRAERITEHGRFALHPRISRDGARLAYAAQDGRGITRTRVIELASGRVVDETRRNGLGPVGWLPDGEAFVLSQLEYHGPYHVLRDLYVVDGQRERQLSDGARLQDPDVDPTGERVVAVENGGGTNRLVIFDLGSPRDARRAGTGRSEQDGFRVLADFDPDVNWALPRWSPDGDHIAVARWASGGEYDVVVLDSLGRLVVQLTRDRAIDTAPAWSPDGRTIVFSSDRTGIPNLYAADLRGEAPVVRQVTNVLTGAFYPDVSPDGRWIYYSEYGADGYHIARLRFDPGTWRDLPPLRPWLALSSDSTSPWRPMAADAGAADDGPSRPASAERPGEQRSPEANAVEEHGNAQVSGVRAYSAWRSVLPKFWMPIGYSGVLDELYLGAVSHGQDLLGRHAWSAAVTAAPSSGRFEGGFGYSFAGLGNPVLSLDVSRDWDRISSVLVDSVPRAAVASEDLVSLTASLVRRRWRSHAVLTAGVEGAFVRREIVDPTADDVRHPNQRHDMLGIVGSAAYANFVIPAYAISREDGVSLSVAGRARREMDSADNADQGYREASARVALYKAVPLPGFANHVAALRVSGITRRGGGAEPTDIGGAPGGQLNALGLALAGGSELLPVRGFAEGEREGTTAWTATLEYRVPIALVGRRPPLSPLFIDRLSATLFADAGDAWCTGEAAARYSVCRPEYGGARSPRSPLVSVGAELVIDAALGSIAGGRLRLGAGLPLEPSGSPALYVQFGSAF